MKQPLRTLPEWLIGLLIGLLCLPAFFMLDSTLIIGDYYLTIPPESHILTQWQKQIQQAIPTTGNQRFILHQVFFISLILGAFFMAWRAGSRMQIRHFFTLSMIKHMFCAAITCFIAGFLFYFGMMFLILERFDFWQLLSGLFDFSAMAWLALGSGLVSAAIILHAFRKRGK